jgi:hypothetical protein
MSTRSGIRIRPQTSGIRYLAPRLLGRKIDGGLAPAGGPPAPPGASPGKDRVLWLRADDLAASLSDTDPVTAWTDRDGNGFDFSQGTESNRPTWNASTTAANGKSTISFAGDDFLEREAAIFTTQPYTAYVVCMTADDSATQTTFSFANNSSEGDYHSGWLHSNNGMYSRLVRNTGLYRSAGPTSAYTENQFHIMTMDAADVDDHTIQRDGGSLASFSSYSMTMNSFDYTTIGITAGQTASHFLTGDIAEVICYGRRLAADDKALTDNYIAARYGITLIA